MSTVLRQTDGMKYSMNLKRDIKNSPENRRVQQVNQTQLYPEMISSHYRTVETWNIAAFSKENAALGAMKCTFLTHNPHL